MRQLKTFFLLTAGLILLCFSSGLSFLFDEASAATLDELRQAIETKTKELEKITNDIKQTQAELEKIEAEKQTLSRDIKELDYTINQLSLSIRSSEVNIEKLKLELELLASKKAETENSINTQKEAIAKVLREIQQNDNENIIYIFLKKTSLADGLLEMQSLQKLQNNLSLSVAGLTELYNDLKQNIETTSLTKKKLEMENANLKNRQAIASDKKAEKKSLLNLAKSKAGIYQQQLDELEERQATIGREIEDLEAKLRASFDPNVLPFKRSGVLAYPVLNPLITQEYGATSFARRAYKSKFHNGIDFKAAIGDPIIAAASGSVIATGDNGRIQYGKYIVIKHDNNLATLYAHLSKIIVAKGEYVKVGQIIGYAGNSGYVTGPHLHFGVYWAPSLTFQSFPGGIITPVGVTVNPKDYL